MIHRRGFLIGLGAALAAPAIIRTPGLLMPVRPLAMLSEAEIEALLGQIICRAFEQIADSFLKHIAEESATIKRMAILAVQEPTAALTDEQLAVFLRGTYG